MAITARDLSRNTGEVLDRIESDRRPQIVLRRGKPVAALIPLDADELDDLLLAAMPGLAEMLAEADRDLAEGRSFSLEEALAALDSGE